MIRKCLGALLSLFVLSAFVGCGGGSGGSNSSAKQTSKGNVSKIGVMTTTISQSEEAYRAAEAMIQKYPGRIVHMTYPEKFTTEQETTISTMMGLASDPDVKAIVCCESVVGTAAAFNKVRAVRPDILLYAGLVSDDSRVIAAAADIIAQTDVPGYHVQIADAAKDMGAKTFVYYSFPRHQSRDFIALGRARLEETCKKDGLKFVFETSPDPMSDAGVAGSQQFILEDVKRKVAEYGRDTAFFSTNIGQAEPLVKAILEKKAIFTMPSDPSPFSAYPGALGISIPKDKLGDASYIEGEISRILKENNMSGRMGLWSVPVLTMYLKGGIEYAVSYLNGDFKEKANSEWLKKSLEKVTNGSPVNIRPFVLNGKEELKNYFYILGTFKKL